jgi:nucleoside-diphosphate-sugar epimerase
MAHYEYAAIFHDSLILAPTMKCVLTGASGFVGSQLKSFLAEKDIDVVAFGRGADPVHVLAGVDVLVHLAARVHVMNDRSIDPLAEFREANVVATGLLARQAAKAGVQRFVYVSSVKVNGEATVPGKPFTEKNTANPQDAYGISKWEAEQELMKIAAETGIEVVIVRPPLIYGPGVKANFASLMRAVAKRRPLPLAAIRNLRSFVGLGNLVDFIHCCMTHPNAANQTFMVSDGKDVSTPQLINKLALAMGAQPNLWSVPLWMLELVGALIGKRAAVVRVCGNLQVDISKAHSLLGWQPPYSFEEGLRRTVDEVNIS